MSVCPFEIGNPSWSASAWVLAASTTDESGRQNGQTRAGLGVGECTGTMGFLNEACGDEQADVVLGVGVPPGWERTGMNVRSLGDEACSARVV
jgi:hypothetical protein